MKYFSLIWMALWRRRTRTIFTLLSITMAFFLIGMLWGISTSINRLALSGRLDHLIVGSPANLPLPSAYASQMAAIPDVTSVVGSSQFFGFYQSPGNFIVAFPTDPKQWFAFYSPKWQIPHAQLEALVRTRTGAVISTGLAERLKWKVGDHIAFRAMDAQRKDGSFDWYIDVVGIFDIPDDAIRTQPIVIMNYDYFNEARMNGVGSVQSFRVATSSPAVAERVAGLIDAAFINSSSQTKTETERENAQGQLAQLGDIDFFVRAIVSAVFFTLLFLTGNAMAQSFRERIPDFAVLKTIGFPNRSVLALVLTESLLLCLSAGGLGLVLATIVLPIFGQLSGGTVPASMPALVFIGGLGAAVFLALLSGLPPALRAKRLSIVAALAQSGGN
jgi:putative ABC transport system permease protein